MTRTRAASGVAARAYRSGVTLLELLVVMVVILAIAAITFPLMRTMLGDTRVAAAGDMIRARLAETRALAMEQGKPYRFTYVVNTGRWQIAAEDDKAWESVEAGEIDLVDLQRGELPREVVFCKDDSALSDPDAQPAAGGGWEEGVVYFSNGSALDDVTITFGKAGLPPMQVRLRGLTGAVSLVDPSLEASR